MEPAEPNELPGSKSIDIVAPPLSGPFASVRNNIRRPGIFVYRLAAEAVTPDGLALTRPALDKREVDFSVDRRRRYATLDQQASWGWSLLSFFIAVPSIVLVGESMFGERGARLHLSNPADAAFIIFFLTGWAIAARGALKMFSLKMIINHQIYDLEETPEEQGETAFVGLLRKARIAADLISLVRR